MSMKVGSRQVDGVTIVDCSGRLTFGEGSVILRDTVRDLLSKGHKKIVLNLQDVNYIDSSGIGELVSAFHHHQESGRRTQTAQPHQEGQRPAADHQALHRLRRKGRPKPAQSSRSGRLVEAGFWGLAWPVPLWLHPARIRIVSNLLPFLHSEIGRAGIIFRRNHHEKIPGLLPYRLCHCFDAGLRQQPPAASIHHRQCNGERQRAHRDWYFLHPTNHRNSAAGLLVHGASASAIYVDDSALRGPIGRIATTCFNNRDGSRGPQRSQQRIDFHYKND